MPWVHIIYHFGPGRQSSHEEYRYFSKASKKEIELFLEEYDPPFMAYAEDGPVVTKYKVLKALPAHIHKSKVRKYKGQREYAAKMLKILESTKTRTEYWFRCDKCRDHIDDPKLAKFKKYKCWPSCGGKLRKEPREF